MNFHLVQVNIAIAKYAYDDPRFAGFVDNLARVYELAESLPGFVWRHVTVNHDIEAKHRLDRLQHSGPTEDAFTFRNFFEAPQTGETAHG